MNGKLAKKIRKIVYGENLSPRHREYIDSANPHKPWTEVRTADIMRRNYQNAKKFYYEKVRGW
jgi:hypothetical protein